MEEKRRSKRIPVKIQLEINTLFKQNYICLENINTEIEVVDISRTGLAFLTNYELPLDYYFNAKIELANKDFFYAVIKIIRKEKQGDYIKFGCEFIGLAEFLANKIVMYEETL
ncbi:PilZ domain-containing protein [Natranaerovirga pectinivora]|uniref:PilZ domain-containing protein n=1 Tax=Natranaerovirga pectinivora TaxID=682400 RepID=A0A4R3MJY4_9FIRM|nr:PilZ domain-containing protein [Natranaerovirga pectinivora]TCT13807.1 PilZ domain-containing protein [Natranaerovirga pectinivora]